MQAGLHAGEWPSVGALHILSEKLRQAEAKGDLRSEITLVPFANPMGLNQSLFGALQGRFDTGTRTNFNRDFPLLERPDPSLLPSGPMLTAVGRLKARLVELSLGADIILDLHCDDESLQYFYVHSALWPHVQDLAAALECDAVLQWQGDSDGAFEEAAIAPWLAQNKPDPDHKVVATVELRGLADVSEQLAHKDAEGLMRFLIGRGAVAGQASDASWKGVTGPLEWIDVIRAPVGGGIWFDVNPGDVVKKGDRVATILHHPGDPDGATPVFAPQAGTVITRVANRVTRLGGDLLKIMGSGPSQTFKPGALEA